MPGPAEWFGLKDSWGVLQIMASTVGGQTVPFCRAITPANLDFQDLYKEIIIRSLNQGRFFVKVGFRFFWFWAGA